MTPARRVLPCSSRLLGQLLLLPGRLPLFLELRVSCASLPQTGMLLLSLRKNLLCSLGVTKRLTPAFISLLPSLGCPASHHSLKITSDGIYLPLEKTNRPVLSWSHLLQGWSLPSSCLNPILIYDFSYLPGSSCSTSFHRLFFCLTANIMFL